MLNKINYSAFDAKKILDSFFSMFYNGYFPKRKRKLPILYILYLRQKNNKIRVK